MSSAADMPGGDADNGHAGLPPLRVLIVDDEPLARVRLRSLVETCPEPRAK